MPQSRKKSLLINPIIARNIHEPHRTATPLELFYDLVYVVAIAFLSADLHHAIAAWHNIARPLAMYYFIFFCVWWSWNNYTWFASGYDTGDAQFRLASFIQMIGAIILAVAIEPAFKDGHFDGILTGYTVMRIPRVLLWLKVAYDDIGSRPVAIRSAIGLVLLQFAWIVGIVYYPYWFVFIGIIVLELSLPFYAKSAVEQSFKFHLGHIEERLSLLTIIVLGESVTASIYSFKTLVGHYSTDMAKLVAGSLMILFSMWWLYFDDKVKQQMHSLPRVFLWSYGHFFIFTSATAVGAFIGVNIDVYTGNAAIGESAAVMTLAIAIAIYLVAVWFSHDYFLARHGIVRYELLLLAAAVLLIALSTNDILLIGMAFITLNITRLLRQHLSCRQH